NDLKYALMEFNVYYLMTGSGQPQIIKASVINHKIPLPPLPEQKRIAYVLSTVQEVKEKTENTIKALKEFKKSMMRHLFTYGHVSPEKTDTVELKETEIGRMSKHWKVVRLGEVASIKTSFPPFSSIVSKQIKYYDVCIHALKVSDMNLPQNTKFITSPAIVFYANQEFIKKTLKPLSIVFPKRGGAIGTNKKRITSSYSILDPNLIGVEPSEEVDYLFLYEFLNKVDLKIIQHQTTVPQLNKNDVARILLPLPPLSEQQQIASILSAIDESIDAAEKKKQALEELFRSLLHNLMTGKIRVNQIKLEENHVQAR
ncbi:restriction endonuclease subunit S, partial [Thermodesulfovibrio hydrogeniphilus]